MLEICHPPVAKARSVLLEHGNEEAQQSSIWIEPMQALVKNLLERVQLVTHALRQASIRGYAISHAMQQRE